MNKDGGLSERERQDAEREADHQARREHLAGGTVSDEETEEKTEENLAEEPKPKPKARSRARAKSSAKS